MQVRPSIADFGRLPRNTRVTLLAQPLWSIPAGLVTSFASLYMMELGVTSYQVGLISSISTMVKLVVALVAGWVIDRLGRKRAQVAFDIVSWLVPYYLWSTATGFSSFLLAGIFNGFVIVNTIVYECYHIEDVPLSMRMSALRYKSVAEYAYGFMPFVTGMLINRFTLVPALRGCYWFGLVCCALFVLTKAISLRDTSVGERQRAARRGGGFTPMAVLRDNLEGIRYILGQRALAALYLTHTLVMFGRSLSSLYFLPYLTQTLGLSSGVIGFVPILTTTISFLVTYLVIPRVAAGRHGVLLGLAFLALTLGGLAIGVATAATAVALLLANIGLWGFANACTATVLQVKLHAHIRDDIRSRVMSAFQWLSMLIMLPAGILGGTLYAHNGAYPLLAVSAVFACAAGLYWALLRRGWFNPRAREEQ